MTGEALSRARELRRTARWEGACAEFRTADRDKALDAGDLDAWAEAAQLTGRHDEAVSSLERAFALRAAASDVDAAASDAFWLYTEYQYAREFAHASGWLSRLHTLADALGADQEPGWLLIAAGRRCIGEARYDDARAVLAGALEQGRARGDVDLECFARVLTGRALLSAGRIGEGLAQLDEAMLRVMGGHTSPRISSILYCAAIGTCEAEAWELARAQEWARALERWMASLPPGSGGTFLDHCRVYRAALKRRRGQLGEAKRELTDAARSLADGHGVLVAGHAWYELGEVHRLLGEDQDAELAYRRAAALGTGVHPGLALLRLAQGDLATALTGLRRALAETTRDHDRGHLLPAMVTVSLAAGAMDDATAALSQLDQVATAAGTSALLAELTRARGAVALAAGHPESALPDLRRSAGEWRGLDAPYDVAVTAVLIADACRAVGDDEGAELEADAAHELFRRMGVPDPRAPRVRSATPPAPGLSRRELEVLRLVAAGRTNRAIASELFLSERTVHRHLSSIFDKLGVQSRTQAATYAVEHRLA